VKTLSIGQLATLAGVSVEAVRFYEREGLLEEAARGSSGYRAFPASAVGRLLFVQRAQQLGFTLREVRRLLAAWLEHDAPHEEVCVAVDDKVAELEKRAHELLQKAEALRELCSDCRGSLLAEDCPVIRALADGPLDEIVTPDSSPTSLRCRTCPRCQPKAAAGTADAGG
jgi:MerR family copper efflux transcriptional regulator